MQSISGNGLGALGLSHPGLSQTGLAQGGAWPAAPGLGASRAEAWDAAGLTEGLPGMGEAARGPSFQQVLRESLQQVNAAQHQADAAVEQLMTGAAVNPAEVLTAVQKADLTFRMMLQVRNKLVQAYQEIKDIRV